MEILSVLSRLLDYPTEALHQNEAVIRRLVAESALNEQQRDDLLAFVSNRLSMDLMDWQEEYDGLFERGRSLGLWLFEHVHGESRDRGQAMVDLMATYKEAGLEISQQELPDYIPLFLEFLATQSEDNAQGWLQDVEHILALLLCRLEKRDSDYAVVFRTILTLSGSNVSLDELRQQVEGEKRDDTREAIDKEWEDEEVTFGAESLEKSCDSAKRRPSESQRKDLDVPVSWVGFDDATQTTVRH